MRLLLISALLFFLSSCNKKQTCFEKEDEIAIQKCINKVIHLKQKYLLESCYLVSPYLDTLSLAPYSKKEKELLFKTTAMSEEIFNKTKTDVLQCRGYYEESLIKLSKCNEGYGVFKVNIVHKKLIQIRFTEYYDQVKIQELKDNIKLQPSQIFEYSCVLKKNGEVEILLETATFYD